MPIPFLQELGVEFVDMADGQAQVALTLAPRHLNSWHVAHGGVIMTLLDTVMSMAGRSLDPNIRSGVTIEMKTSFMEPGGGEGSRMLAKGRVLKSGASLCFAEAEVWNDDRLVAKASGTFKFVRRSDIAKKMGQETGRDRKSGEA
ncbi:MAG TPA: PaaI family thioesterase [Oxalicibacterium sp.]|nr:PaaI family thioesterase [Oxalicibacterium sp.]